MPQRGGPARVLGLVLLAAMVARAEVVNRIVATVDGEPITAHELERYAAERRAGDADRAALLDALITERLLRKEAAAQGIVIREADVDAYIAQVKERNRLDDARFEEAIRAEGLTLDAYRRRVKEELEKSQLVNREIRARVSVSPEEIARYYEANRAEFTRGTGITLRSLLLRVPALADEAEVARIRARAEELRQRAMAGADFAALAREHSEGPGAATGGLLGTFAPDELAPAVAAAVRGLRPGDISPVVRTDAGFQILAVESLEGEGVRPLEEVREEIRERLYDAELQRRFEAWLSRDLRERHSVEVLP